MSPMQKFCVGHVDFMLFVSISFALGSQRKPSFQWKGGFTPTKREGRKSLSRVDRYL